MLGVHQEYEGLGGVAVVHRKGVCSDLFADAGEGGLSEEIVHHPSVVLSVFEPFARAGSMFVFVGIDLRSSSATKIAIRSLGVPTKTHVSSLCSHGLSEIGFITNGTP